MRYGIMTAYQTMLNLSAIVIKKTDYPKGALVVLLSKSSDEGCYKKTTKPDHEQRSFKVK